ncbi:unnamed protein product, partial [Polarella glacialis]
MTANAARWSGKVGVRQQPALAALPHSAHAAAPGRQPQDPSNLRWPSAMSATPGAAVAAASLAEALPKSSEPSDQNLVMAAWPPALPGTSGRPLLSAVSAAGAERPSAGEHPSPLHTSILARPLALPGAGGRAAAAATPKPAAQLTSGLSSIDAANLAQALAKLHAAGWAALAALPLPAQLGHLGSEAPQVANLAWSFARIGPCGGAAPSVPPARGLATAAEASLPAAAKTGWATENSGVRPETQRRFLRKALASCSTAFLADTELLAAGTNKEDLDGCLSIVDLANSICHSDSKETGCSI